MKVRGENFLQKIVGDEGPSEQIIYRNDLLGAPENCNEFYTIIIIITKQWS